MKTVKTLMANIPINIFKVQIDIKFLHEAIANFEHKNDGLIPYLIMNEKTLDRLKVQLCDTFELYDTFVFRDVYLTHGKEGNYINKFEGCKIVIDCTLEDGQVLLR